jgi:hypothetical protein
MNDHWKEIDADAHAAKAEALDFAAQTLAGVEAVLDAVEAPVIRNAVSLLTNAKERHEQAAVLGRAA